MSTIGTTLFSKIEINGQEVDIATLDANDGIYALPAGQTTANVKFTMIDNTSIPRGVFEENSYITAMTLPDAMTYIASYSFHGVNNINISDKNAILAINPYAFDAEPEPTPPSPTDPDFYFSESNYEITSGHEVVMKNYLTNNTGISSTQYPIQWSSSSADIEITSQSKGRIRSYTTGATGTITATISDGTNTHTATCTVNVVADKQYPSGGWYNNGTPIGSIDVVPGGSSTYTLTFSGTPNDSWTFTINSSSTNGVSVDSAGTITINESQMNNVDNFSITAYRPADTSYYEGNGIIGINIIAGKTDPDIYFMSPSLSIDYQNSPNQLNGTEVTQALSGNDASSGAWITWMTNDSSIATINHGGYVIAHGNGTVTIAAEYTAHDNYNSKTVQYQLTITGYISGGKQYPTGGWYKDGNMINELAPVQGGSSTYTLTFSANPSDSWTFSDPIVSGISVDTSTGTITVTEANLNDAYNYIVNATRSEDTNYYPYFTELNIRVLPTGSDPKFYYLEKSASVNNQSSTTVSPTLHNEYVGLQGYNVSYSSDNTKIATVDNNGVISFAQDEGSTTVTATLTYDGSIIATTSIIVYSTVIKSYASVSFVYNLTTYEEGTLPVVAPFTGTIQLTNKIPSEGWSITDPMIQGITVDNMSQTINAQGLSQGTYEINVHRDEDTNYYNADIRLRLKVLPSGSNTNFYYQDESVTLTQEMNTSYPGLTNNTNIDVITYQSADTSIATVDNNGRISFVSAGNTTITASITDGVDTYTTSITVNCMS